MRLLLALAFVCFFISCNPAKQSDLEGLWVGSYQEVESGTPRLNTHLVIFEFMADSTFTAKKYVSQTEKPIQRGEYSLSGRNLLLYSETDTAHYHLVSSDLQEIELVSKGREKFSAYSLRKIGLPTQPVRLANSEWSADFGKSQGSMGFHQDSTLDVSLWKHAKPILGYWEIDHYNNHEVLLIKYSSTQFSMLIEAVTDTLISVQVITPSLSTLSLRPMNP